ncbi:MAG: hypothetical protein KDG89_10505 [Geminicoccaceae bacterium]|nr:hypothetical protein [Geminicoccaceae bacterium]
MRLAYSISAYKLPGQFRWLMDAIWHPDDVYAVHVDAKTPPEVLAAFEAAAAGRPNVRFIAREPVVWMGQGLVNAELRAIGELLRMAPDFGHLIALSGQDYPLKPRHEIAAALASTPDLNYVRLDPLRDLPFHVRRRPYLFSFEHGGRLVKTPLPRPIPRGLKIAWKGSWWRVLSRDFCAWLTDAPETKAYWRFLKNVQAPDELFFQNLLMASPFRDRVVPQGRHFVLWPGDSGSPLTLGTAHEAAMLASGQWYARKFDATVDADILARLAARIGAPAPRRKAA